METPTRPSREPRTFELRDSEWVEDTGARRPRAPLWLLIPIVFAALTGMVLVVFATLVALATAALLRARAGVMRLFGR